MLDSTVTAEVQDMLDSLNAALEEGDAQAASALFATDSYWRDLIAVTWNLKTVEGPAGVQDMLAAQLKHTKPTKFSISNSNNSLLPNKLAPVMELDSSELLIL